MRKYFILSLLILCGFVFTAWIQVFNEYDPVPIPPSAQRLGGDPQKGYEYLTTGDYVKGGVPYSSFVMGLGKDKRNLLQRDGKNENLPFAYTAVTASNGEILVAPNCLQCHAEVFNGELILGLGNTSIDFTQNDKMNIKNLKTLESWLKLTAPKKYQAAKSFIEVAKAIGNNLQTDVQGVNAADRLAALLVAHRDPVTFKWNDTAQLDIPGEVIPTDVPAWWLLKKKHAMFYNGFGRGDFGKFLGASNLLTVVDTSESAEVDSHMPDLLAYIYSLQPPKYPGPIDGQLATAGEKVFINNCSKCHGTYGEGGQFPNLLIPAAVIQTDSMLSKSNYSNPQFVAWFNKSWFTQGSHPARLEPFDGYLAQPLDGIWATAPYLHNGSVPTLEALLNSDLRPAYWSRNFDKPEYNYDQLGWVYKKQEQPGKNVYNTHKTGYGNYGHSFGDRLTPEERKAVLEYLKKL
ncbi:c-type cytochrome [Paraflavitalea sp. CAU 1676]|uniref:c-type cytochrome n=1 Tax=Paraflavitalea sp. CAU 1676 TaxID=3032598 RepID=UPI0023DC2313|nr:c-type cytochrome [Paraflavitalea sp. CAU 1676]MDF2189440.1 c-type cytochrome [Paraflavitalea sp. CAU 1676]